MRRTKGSSALKLVTFRCQGSAWAFVSAIQQRQRHRDPAAGGRVGLTAMKSICTSKQDADMADSSWAACSELDSTLPPIRFGSAVVTTNPTENKDGSLNVMVLE